MPHFMGTNGPRLQFISGVFLGLRMGYQALFMFLWYLGGPMVVTMFCSIVKKEGGPMIELLRRKQKYNRDNWDVIRGTVELL